MWLALGVAATLAAVAGWVLIDPGASAQKRKPLRFANFAAPAFVPVTDSTHNDGDPVCGAFVPSQQGAENQGDLNAKMGSFLANVQLPQGARVESLAMFANDFSDQDAHVFLIRKRIQDGLDPQFDGYSVMGQVSTADAVNGVMRRFTDSEIANSRIANGRFYYFLELVVCDAIEPFAIQVGYR